MKAKIKAYDNSITSACDGILEKQGYNKDRFKGRGWLWLCVTERNRKPTRLHFCVTERNREPTFFRNTPTPVQRPFSSSYGSNLITYFLHYVLFNI